MSYDERGKLSQLNMQCLLFTQNRIKNLRLVIKKKKPREL